MGPLQRSDPGSHEAPGCRAATRQRRGPKSGGRGGRGLSGGEARLEVRQGMLLRRHRGFEARNLAGQVFHGGRRGGLRYWGEVVHVLLKPESNMRRRGRRFRHNSAAPLPEGGHQGAARGLEADVPHCDSYRAASAAMEEHLACLCLSVYAGNHAHVASRKAIEATAGEHPHMRAHNHLCGSGGRSWCGGTAAPRGCGRCCCRACSGLAAASLVSTVAG
mmetsp:Transcript_93939/g.201613  ORF Transcript_93939/g.201613 Transcript_93939/m.201613 type:complete len:219 (-) Transcript_93939:54-710(-)